MKRKRCGGTVVYEVIGGMRVYTQELGGSPLYSAKCMTCGFQWQDNGKSKVCRALTVPPPLPAPLPLPDPPYGLIRVEGEMMLTTSVAGLEVVLEDGDHLDLSDLVVVTRDFLRGLEDQGAPLFRSTS